MEIRLAFVGFNPSCGHLVRALSLCKGVKVVGILGRKPPRDWPSDMGTPPLYAGLNKLFQEASPDLLLLANGTKDLGEIPADCQVLEVKKESPVACLLEMLSKWVVEGRKLRGELQEIAAICTSTNVVEAYSDPLPKLSQLLDRALALSGAEEGMVLFPGEEVDSLKVVLARGERSEKMVGKTVSIERSICGKAFDLGAMVHRTVGPEAEEYDFLSGGEENAVLALPMRAEGRVEGVLALVYAGDGFEADRIPFLALAADQAGLAVLIARLYSELETNVVKDFASSLYNRNFFLQRLHEEISRARRYSLNVCLVFLEIDDFENYVERNGRFLGDLVISDVGSIIRRNTREVDTAARYEGHLFAVLLPETRRLGAMRLAERIRKVVEEYPFPSRERKEVETLTMSAGVASYPANADNEDALLKKALAALAAAKAEGPNRVRLYSEELGESA